MIIYSYTDSAGAAHWPDATIGSEKYYGIDFDEFLTNENDTWTGVSWIVPSGMTNMDEVEVSNEVRIKLSADAVGDYEIICELETVEGADTQKIIQKMLISVI